MTGGTGWGSRNFIAFDDYKSSPYIPIPLPTRAGIYDALYRRYYGQVYFAHPLWAKDMLGGLSFRSVYVDYSRLTYAGQPIIDGNNLFLEPSFFLRYGRGFFRYYATGGLSLPLGSGTNDPVSQRTAAVSYLLGAGIIFRPDLLWHHDH